jgi:hypothetical protein
LAVLEAGIVTFLGKPVVTPRYRQHPFLLLLQVVVVVVVALQPMEVVVVLAAVVPCSSLRGLVRLLVRQVKVLQVESGVPMAGHWQVEVVAAALAVVTVAQARHILFQAQAPIMVAAAAVDMVPSAAWVVVVMLMRIQPVTDRADKPTQVVVVVLTIRTEPVVQVAQVLPFCRSMDLPNLPMH